MSHAMPVDECAMTSKMLVLALCSRSMSLLPQNCDQLECVAIAWWYVQHGTMRRLGSISAQYFKNDLPMMLACFLTACLPASTLISARPQAWRHWFLHSRSGHGADPGSGRYRQRVRGPCQVGCTMNASAEEVSCMLVRISMVLPLQQGKPNE